MTTCPNVPEEMVPDGGDDIVPGEYINEDKGEDEIEDFDFEIVGLHRNSNGRSCCCHETCGLHVSKNDVLRIVKTVVTVDNQTEEAVKLVKIEDGVFTCIIAFIPQIQLKEA